MRRLTIIIAVCLMAPLCVGTSRRRVIYPVEARKYITIDPDSLSGPTTPVSPDATGTIGTVFWDTDYLYVCIANNTWERVALATWTIERDLRTIAGNDLRMIAGNDLRTVEVY